MLYLKFKHFSEIQIYDGPWASFNVVSTFITARNDQLSRNDKIVLKSTEIYNYIKWLGSEKVSENRCQIIWIICIAYKYHELGDWGACVIVCGVMCICNMFV